MLSLKGMSNRSGHQEAGSFTTQPLTALLLPVFVCLCACSYSQSAGQDKSCEVRLQSSGISAGELQLSVYSSCHLHTYPHVLVRSRQSGTVLHRGEYDLYRQRAGSTDTYAVKNVGNSFSLEDVDLFMVSDMGAQEDIIK